MAPTPHPITVTVRQTDNSTALPGARVYVRNATKRTSSAEAVTNSSGQAIIDLANLPIAPGQTEPYEAGDQVLIIAYKGNQSDAAEYFVTGSSKAQTLNMNHALHRITLTAEKIRTLIVANNHASTAYNARVLAVDDGQTLAHIICPGKNTHSIYLEGLSASGGYAIIREATDVIVTTILK